MILRIDHKEDWDLLEQKMLQSWNQELEQEKQRIQNSIKIEDAAPSAGDVSPSSEVKHGGN